MPPLAYDFDMFSVMPDEVFADPKMRAMLKDAGITQRMAGNRIALFRDPRTVAALRAAPQSIRDWLRASGFGENVHPSGIPAGQYRASDEQDRLRIMNSLTANVSTFPLPKAGSPEAVSSDFRLAEFLTSITTAEPVADAVLDAALRKARPTGQPTPRRTAMASPLSGLLRPRMVLALAVIAGVFVLSQVVAGSLGGLAETTVVSATD